MLCLHSMSSATSKTKLSKDSVCLEVWAWIFMGMKILLNLVSDMFEKS